MSDFRALLESVRAGRTSVDDALHALKRLDTETLGFSRIDHHRALRQGLAEVIYGEGKTADETRIIFERLWAREAPVVLATRVPPETAAPIAEAIPEARYHERARLLVATRNPPPEKGHIVVAAAGTSDLPVAEEAFYAAEAMGNRVDLLVDVGVAGIHRLFEELDRLLTARVVIVVAGMEGALASVVGGLVDAPVLAVPAPVGYGAAFGGVTALLAMLSSCALGVGVLNIGNGIGAAALASKINQLAEANGDP